MPKLIFFCILHFGIHWGPSYHELMGFKFFWRHQISLLRVIYAILAPNMDPPGNERGVRKFEHHHFWPIGTLLKPNSKKTHTLSTYNKTTGVSDHLKKLWPIKHRHVFFYFWKMCACACCYLWRSHITSIWVKNDWNLQGLLIKVSLIQNEQKRRENIRSACVTNANTRDPTCTRGKFWKA